MARDSDRARVTEMRALQLLREKRYADALQVCTDELARGVDDPQLRLVAAHSLLAQGRHEGAKKEAQQVLRLDPNVAEAHRILADVCCARGELATACEHLERVLATAPGDQKARSLLETLSRSHYAAGDETVPMPGALAISVRAASLDRFIEGGEQERDALDDSIVDISDSMMEELPTSPKPVAATALPKRRSGEIELERRSGEVDRAMAGWIPAEPSGPQRPAPMMHDFEGLPEAEDAPTMPLLRPSGPKEPELKLDPRAARPVSASAPPAAATPAKEQPTRRVARAVPADLLVLPERGPTTEPISPSQLIGGDGDDFEDFDVEPASVPLPRPARQPLRDVPDPVKARESIRRPEPAAAEPAPRTEAGGDLMDLLTGGGVNAREDDSLGDIRTGRQQKAERGSLQTLEREAIAPGFEPEPDPGFADPGFRDPGFRDPGFRDPGFDSGAGAADFDSDAGDAWDPLADLATRARPRAEPSDFDELELDGGRELDRELAAAGLAPRPRQKGRGRWVLFFVLLAMLGAGGGYGYYWYRTYKFIQAEWQKARVAIYLGTPAGYGDAQKAAQAILRKRAKNAEALAALGMGEAALSIEFGLDRRAQAQKALERTKGRDSEWRTAAQSFLTLIEDPSSAAGYLAKGIEVFPKSALLRYLQGRALMATEREQASADAFQAALKLAPAFVSARLALAGLLGRQEKGYDQAASMFDEVLKRHPGHIQALVDRARLRAQHNKELEGAIADLRRVTTELSTSAGQGQTGWAQLVLAQVHRRRGQVQTMSEALDAAIKSPPCCDSFFRYELAGELMGLFRLRDAYQQMLAALSLNKREARYLQRTARLLLAMDRPDRAAGYVAQAPAGQPETKVLAARLAYARGRYEDAEGALKPLFAEPKVAVEARLYAALAQARLKKTKDALAGLEALSKELPALDTAPLFRGLIHLRARDYKLAETALKQAWRINKLDPRTPTLLAHVSLATHDIDRAAKRFARALLSRPDYAPAHIGLGELHLEVGELGAARAQLAKISEDDRELVAYRVLEVRLAAAEGQHEKAENGLELVRKAGGAALLVTRLQGELALAKKDGPTALPLLKKAQKGDPRDAELLVLLGEAQLLAKKVDDSYDTFHAVLKVDPGQPVALLKLGRIAVRDGEHALAERRLKEALRQMKLRKKPKSLQAAAFTALGLAFLGKRDTGRAITNLQDAMELDPQAAEPQYQMGVTYDRLDRPQRSIGYYKKALALDPSYADAYKRLGLALAKLGQPEAAVKQLTTYLEKAPKAKDSGEIRNQLRKLKKGG